MLPQPRTTPYACPTNNSDMIDVLKPLPLTLATATLVAFFLILHSCTVPDPSQSNGSGISPSIDRRNVLESPAPPAASLDDPPRGTGQTEDREHASAPCDQCLDERQAIDLVIAYLVESNVQYLGEPHAEIIENFPWTGYGDVSFVYDREPATWDQKSTSGMIEPPRPIIYVAERRNGDAVPNDDTKEDLTWRVSYQYGWISTEYIEQEVDAGFLPLEVLAWPPQKQERDVLVHARTGVLKHLVGVHLH